MERKRHFISRRNRLSDHQRNVNEILISRLISEVETTLRQFRLKNDKKSAAAKHELWAEDDGR